MYIEHMIGAQTHVLSLYMFNNSKYKINSKFPGSTTKLKTKNTYENTMK